MKDGLESVNVELTDKTDRKERTIPHEQDNTGYEVPAIPNELCAQKRSK